MPGAGLTVGVAAANAGDMAEEPSTPDLATLSFEDALRALEQIVRRLESGDVPLDESISLYAKGEELRKRCAERLQAAEARIAKLTVDANGAVTGAQAFGAD
ncbi:Exodeoxyribonuclease VII small subunit [Sphingobium sp. AP50]|nr:Exodeoxyribonuclease VII small subunit [Sphingobium sp. AP50]